MLGVCSCNSIDGTELPNAACCDEDTWEAMNASIAVRSVGGETKDSRFCCAILMLNTKCAEACRELAEEPGCVHQQQAGVREERSASG